MSKEPKTNYQKLINALIDATNEFFLDPKHKMPIPEVLAAVHVFKACLEQHIAETAPKNKGEK